MTIELNDANFDKIVLKSQKPVMVDFWAEWCGPCRLVGPIVNEMSEEYKEKVIVGKVDVDNSPAISARYGIRSIPTILFFKDGEMVNKQVGAVPKSKLVGKLEALF